MGPGLTGDLEGLQKIRRSAVNAVVPGADWAGSDIFPGVRFQWGPPEVALQHENSPLDAGVTGKLGRAGPMDDNWISGHWNIMTIVLDTDLGIYLPRYSSHLAGRWQVDGYWSVWSVYGKTQGRMYFLRRLRPFNICSTLLWMFYQSVVASVFFYNVVCWGGSTSKKDTSRLDKLIRWAGSVIGMKLDPLVMVTETRTLNKLLDIMDNASHPLHTVRDCSFPSAGLTD